MKIEIQIVITLAATRTSFKIVVPVETEAGGFDYALDFGFN